MLTSRLWILLLSGIAASSAQETTLAEETLDDPEFSGRLGFSLLDALRKRYCNEVCNPINGNSYIINLTCAVKCPELYLPHDTTSTTSATSEKSTTQGTETTMVSTTPAGETTTPAGGTTTPAEATTKPTEGSMMTTTMMPGNMSMMMMMMPANMSMMMMMSDNMTMMMSDNTTMMNM